MSVSKKEIILMISNFFLMLTTVGTMSMKMDFLFDLLNNVIQNSIKKNGIKILSKVINTILLKKLISNIILTKSDFLRNK